MIETAKITFPGQTEFIVAADEELPDNFPRRIKTIDAGKFTEVSLHSMEVSGDEGTRNFRLLEDAKQLSNATAKIYCHVMLNALNGRRKVSTARRWSIEFKLFTSLVYEHTGQKISCITLGMFNWYSRKKGASQQKLLRSFLKYWAKLKLPGIAKDLKYLLETTKSPTPRGPIEIQNSEPSERPFSYEQVRQILSDISDLYIDGTFTTQDNLIWRLIVSEAMRPTQMRLLQFRDVHLEYVGPNKEPRATLMVPIIKQQGTSGRDYMMPYRLSDSVSMAMRDHLNFIQKISNSHIPPEQPLFSLIRPYNQSLQLKDSPCNIVNQIQRTRRRISYISGSLEDEDLFTRRFKHTKLTHLAHMGASLEVLARAGFQTSTISLRHYVNLTNESHEAYEQATVEAHREIYHAFKGRVVERPEATNTDEDHSVLAPNMEDEVGSCSASLCGVLAPFGCYLCPRFEAFSDGAHEAVLADLLAKKQLAIDMKLPAESTELNAPLIAAVETVISKINKRNDNHG